MHCGSVGWSDESFWMPRALNIHPLHSNPHLCMPPFARCTLSFSAFHVGLCFRELFQINSILHLSVGGKAHFGLQMS